MNGGVAISSKLKRPLFASLSLIDNQNANVVLARTRFTEQRLAVQADILSKGLGGVGNLLSSLDDGMLDSKNLATIGNFTRVKGNLLAGRRISELALRRGFGLLTLLCNSTIIVQNISKTNFRTSSAAGSIAGSHTIRGSNQDLVERDKIGVDK